MKKIIAFVLSVMFLFPALCFADESQSINITITLQGVTYSGFYTGSLEDGVASGEGTFASIPSDGKTFVYLGEFANGTFCGKGYLRWNDGRVESGIFTNGELTEADERSNDTPTLQKENASCTTLLQNCFKTDTKTGITYSVFWSDEKYCYYVMMECDQIFKLVQDVKEGKSAEDYKSLTDSFIILLKEVSSVMKELSGCNVNIYFMAADQLYSANPTMYLCITTQNGKEPQIVYGPTV